VHVLDVELSQVDDFPICAHAVHHGYAIISKDAADLALLTRAACGRAHRLRNFRDLRRRALQETPL
jgi:hypothetical protein